jgi:hypothetical protein
MRVTIWAALLICAACASPAHSEASAPVPVGTVTAEKRPVAKALDFVGRVEACHLPGKPARIPAGSSDTIAQPIQAQVVGVDK